MVVALALLVANAAAMSPAHLPRGARNADHYQPKTKTAEELHRQLKHTVFNRLMDTVKKAPKYEHEKHQGESWVTVAERASLQRRACLLHRFGTP